MNYARIENGVVVEIIPAVDEAFPEIPIEDRFHKSIIDQMVEIPSDLDVQQYWTYSEEGFVPPVPVIEPEVEVEPEVAPEPLNEGGSME